MFFTHRSYHIVPLAFLALSTCTCPGQVGRLAKHAALKVYELPEEVNSADISPDGGLVAIERTSRHKSGNGKTILSEVVELWDFHAGRITATADLKDVAVQTDSKEREILPVITPRCIRFSRDGKVIVVFVDNSITVLRASDLVSMGSAELATPPSVTRSFTFHGRTIVTTEKPELQAMEISPTSTLLALLWTSDFIGGRIDLYNISSGQQTVLWAVSVWKPTSLAWDPTSSLIFVSVPNRIGCTAPDSAPDVFGLESRTGSTKVKITTRLFLSDIAVTPSQKLLAVSANCVGVFDNHHPRMKVFDLRTDKHIRDVRADKTGVRYSVSVSGNGERAVAWTSDERCGFDWGDMVCFGSTAKAMLTIWHLPEFSVVENVVVSPPGNGPLRMSFMGRCVLTYGKTVSVLELP